MKRSGSEQKWMSRNGNEGNGSELKVKETELNCGENLRDGYDMRISELT